VLLDVDVLVDVLVDVVVDTVLLVEVVDVVVVVVVVVNMVLDPARHQPNFARVASGEAGATSVKTSPAVKSVIDADVTVADVPAIANVAVANSTPSFLIEKIVSAVAATPATIKDSGIPVLKRISRGTGNLKSICDARGLLS
jgi:hypothetical protein